MYNWDEKGFLIRMVSVIQRIITFEALLSSRITYISQDGSREFISLLVYIYANGTALPPAFIYQGESSIL